MISLVNNNVPFEDISAGIHDSIARRINGMVMKVGLEPEVVLTGGCARNVALIKSLEAIFGWRSCPKILSSWALSARQFLLWRTLSNESV